MMHAGEIVTSRDLVNRLIACQFPQWASLPISPVLSTGTDNALYRLGDDMVVRLPRIHSASGQVDKEQFWLPRLAPELPLPIPIPLARGNPAEGYPWGWSVYRWIDGEPATVARLADMGQTAVDLATFITALQRIDATEGPLPGAHNANRGLPLKARDAETRQCINTLKDSIDTETAIALWEESLHAPLWTGAPVWIHGDINQSNLLAAEGRLCAVIDFGLLGTGDPACDLMVAWNLLSAEHRNVFRKALGADDAMWVRGRGWALSVGLIALPYYIHTNPVLAKIARHTIDEVVAEGRTRR